MLRININGYELTGFDGQSILDIARENNIEIPTLCHDERVKAYGACGVCVVEIENSPKLVRACSTLAADGMVVKTNSPRANATRKMAIEFLCSDHVGDCRPPCTIACPGHTDCQGYVGLIANGQYKEAHKLIKDRIPLPASIGRVCPHPCEEACRRQLVEEPISIAQLKSFAADMDIFSDNPYEPECQPDTRKHIAVIGGGPGGLTAAYFLRRFGHAVTVYDAMDKMGGMLRYGIPEYRLPKSIVDLEVSLIEKLGVKMVNNVKIGRDMTFDHVRNNHDAVVVAIGAWTSSGLRCPGEDLNGVYGGIDFLRDVALSNPVMTGKKVAVVGGGNTAMDACRTAVRLGASEVYVVYRRTKDEMPAEEIEITEAMEEGVVFKFLTNPIEILGNSEGKVSKIRLQIMELGEPDASGRRAPVAVKGKEETLEVDTVIAAIGQGVNPAGFEELSITKWNTIISDERTFTTNVEGVFAVGDATNKGASIAIEAIGEAKRAADVIHTYLNGAIIPFKPEFIITQEITSDKLSDKPKVAREKMKHHTPEARRGNFKEVNFGYSEEQAKKEASRCLECGCADYFECKLIKYANELDAKPEKYAGENHDFPMDLSNPFFYRNPNKCILCGLCVRVCDEVMGRTALGFVDRGFDATVKPSMGAPIVESECISCGQCVHLCPTGALGEIAAIDKNVPVSEKATQSVCTFCDTGCSTTVTNKGNMALRVLPNLDANKEQILCVKGRFGHTELKRQHKINDPLIRKDGKLTPAVMRDALMYVTKKVQGIGAQYGTDSVAVSISDRLTLEDIYLAKKYANEVLNTNNVYSLNSVKSGLKEVLGNASSTNTAYDLLQSEVLILICEDVLNSHAILGIEIKKAIEKGLKLILVSSKQTQMDGYACIKINPSKSLDTLKQMVKALTDMGLNPKNAEGLEELKNALGKVSPTDEIKAAMELYAKAKKGAIMFDQKELTTDAAILVGDMAVISGQIGKPRAGVMPLLPSGNSQGLVDMGVNTDSAQLLKDVEKGKIKTLLVFGEDIPEVQVNKLDFMMVMDCVMTETAEMAEVVLPAATPFEQSGLIVSSQRRAQSINNSFSPSCGYENWEIIKMLANISQKHFSYENGNQVRQEIAAKHKEYESVINADLSQNKVFVGSPVLHENSFSFENGKAKLTAPEQNTMFNESENRNAITSKFIKFLDSKNLIK